MDNDDLDVTKGCEIVVTISSDLSDLDINSTFHNPQIFKNRDNSIKIFAGKGVGVVTKKGLKIPPNLPAINPTPLKSIENIFQKQIEKKSSLNIVCTISVTDGEKIAKQTANEKVGVIGGISILGTSGFVKPISNSAYLDSIQTEITFAKANGYKEIVLTLGNNSLLHAKKLYHEGSIVEIGNFIFDATKIAYKEGFENIVFVCGIGKLVKVSQGYKNTHNRFGSIDFQSIQSYIKEEFDIQIDLKEIKTVKGVVQYLSFINQEYKETFHKYILHEATKVFQQWEPNITVKIIQI